MLLKAIAPDKTNGETKIRESHYPSKSEFIKDLRRNGFSVNPNKVKTADVFDYIMDNTNCNPWDWKEINSVPK